jgi:hypothetical protein
MLSAASAGELDLKNLDKKFKGLPKHLEKAACNIDQVLKLAADQRAVSIKDVVPLSSTEDGMAAVNSLTTIRTKFTTRLIVFREMLLPVSSRVVNALVNLLDFMEDEEVFLELAKAGEVSELCNFHAKDAADVQKGYEYLSADLQALNSFVSDEFKKVCGNMNSRNGLVDLSLLLCCRHPALPASQHSTTAAQAAAVRGLAPAAPVMQHTCPHYSGYMIQHVSNTTCTSHTHI